MALTAREAIKSGFLLACAERGLTEDETRDLIKTALSKDANLLSTLATAGTSLAGLGLVGAGGLGFGAGHVAAKMTEPDITPDEAKKQELITAYQLYADQAIRAAKRRRVYRSPTPTGPRLLR